MDPLLIYRDAGITLWKSVDPALREDEVIIPYATPDGQVRPAGTRIVWPIACEPVK